MEIVKRGNPKEATCQSCGTVIKWDIQDLNWTHNEENYYYMICPVCGKPIWIPRTKELDEQWDNLVNPALNPYAMPNPLLTQIGISLSNRYKQTY